MFLYRDCVLHSTFNTTDKKEGGKRNLKHLQRTSSIIMEVEGNVRVCTIYSTPKEELVGTADIIYCFFYTFLPITWQPKQSHRAHNCLLATRHYDAVKNPFLLPTSPRPKKNAIKMLLGEVLSNRGALRNNVMHKKHSSKRSRV